MAKKRSKPRPRRDAPTTEFIPAFLVKGTAIVELPDGSVRRVQVSRITPAPRPDAAKAAALRHIEYKLQANRTNWKEVSARWIANQYVWTFDEEVKPKEVINV